MANELLIARCRMARRQHMKNCIGDENVSIGAPLSKAGLPLRRQVAETIAGPRFNDRQRAFKHMLVTPPREAAKLIEEGGWDE